MFYISVVDYVVFASVLVLSSGIGIYFARGGRKKVKASSGSTNTDDEKTEKGETEEYLVAGRSMHWIPLSISFMATFISGSSLLGIPAEIYTYGFQYVIACAALFVSTFFTWYIFIPIFYKLKIVCANEYLELRFTPGIRMIGCAVMCLYMLINLSIGLYAPSIALEAVADVPIYATIIVTGMVCVFYTTIGGMKAVIWTDCFQAFVMIAGLFVVIVIGVSEVGSFAEIFELASRGERMQILNFNPDPRIRNTFWSLTIGVGFTILPAWAVGQQSVQRFQAAKSLKEARLALLWNFPSMLFISLLAMMAGLVIYAVNQTCDIGAYGLRTVTRNDQVLPYFIMDKLGHFTGIPGLFMAVLFSSALSTASSNINALSALLLEDFVKKIKSDISDSHAKKSSMFLAFITGCCGIGFSFLISNVGHLVTQISFTAVGTFGSPYLGLFCLGMFFPWANWQGAYVGFACGLGSTIWLSTGATVYPANSYPAVVHTYGCPGFNSTNATLPELKGTGIIRPADEYVPHATPLASFYSISYLWYAVIGLSVTIFMGCLTSLVVNYFSKEKQAFVDEDLLFHFWCSRKYLNQKSTTTMLELIETNGDSLDEPNDMKHNLSSRYQNKQHTSAVNNRTDNDDNSDDVRYIDENTNSYKDNQTFFVE